MRQEMRPATAGFFCQRGRAVRRRRER